MNSFFVGDNKLKPSFLVEIMTKQKKINIYKPDNYSKNETFYEKYSLGKILIETKYDNIIFVKKPVPYKKNLPGEPLGPAFVRSQTGSFGDKQSCQAPLVSPGPTEPGCVESLVATASGVPFAMPETINVTGF